MVGEDRIGMWAKKNDAFPFLLPVGIGLCFGRMCLGEIGGMASLYVRFFTFWGYAR